MVVRGKYSEEVGDVCFDPNEIQLHLQTEFFCLWASCLENHAKVLTKQKKEEIRVRREAAKCLPHTPENGSTPRGRRGVQ